MPLPKLINGNYLFINNTFENRFSTDALKFINFSNLIIDESVAYNGVFPYRDWAIGLEISQGLNVKNGRYIYEITSTNVGFVPEGSGAGPNVTEGSQTILNVTYTYRYDLFNLEKDFGKMNPPKSNGEKRSISSIVLDGDYANIYFTNSANQTYAAGDNIIITGVSGSTGFNREWPIHSIENGYIKIKTNISPLGATYDNAYIIGPYFDSNWIQDSTVYRGLFNNDGSPEEPGLDAGSFDSSNNGIALLRSSLSEGVSNYKQIALFDVTEFQNPKYFYDYLLEPGMLYSYMLQAVNINKSNNKVVSRGATTPIGQRVNIIPDFEGSYLYGTDQVQLNFIYNGKISGFKEVKRDAVIETIGSKYPFVVRSSDIGYKQFQFSALITSIADPLRQLTGMTYSTLMNGTDVVNINTLYEKFILEGSQQVLGDVSSKYYIKTTMNDKNYLNKNENYLVEREFRKKVMDWLYDGKPKVFKSDTEGLFVVKITEISLEPVEEMGRILYSFSCTMTEIDEINTNSLNYYGFRKIQGDLYDFSQIGLKIYNWTPLTDYYKGSYVKYKGEYYQVVESGASYDTPPTLKDPDTIITNIGTYKLKYAGNYIPGYFN